MFLHKVLRRKRRFFQGNFSPAGLTFLEIVISLSLISVGMLLYLEIFNTAMDAHSRSIREIISTNLAQGLMAEIMSKYFADPDDPGNLALGPNENAGVAETRHGGPGNAFDDVDDYLNYNETPAGHPDTVDGSPMDGTAGTPNYLGFRRSVTVSYCNIIANPEPPPDEIIVDVAEPTIYKRVRLQMTDPRGRVTSLVEVKVSTLVAISSSTDASPIVITTSAAHGYATGDRVNIGDHITNIAANGNWIITVLSTTTFSLNGSTGSGAGAGSGGYAQKQ